MYYLSFEKVWGGLNFEKEFKGDNLTVVESQLKECVTDVVFINNNYENNSNAFNEVMDFSRLGKKEFITLYLLNYVDSSWRLFSSKLLDIQKDIQLDVSGIAWSFDSIKLILPVVFYMNEQKITRLKIGNLEELACIYRDISKYTGSLKQACYEADTAFFSISRLSSKACRLLIQENGNTINSLNTALSNSCILPVRSRNSGLVIFECLKDIDKVLWEFSELICRYMLEIRDLGILEEDLREDIESIFSDTLPREMKVGGVSEEDNTIVFNKLWNNICNILSSSNVEFKQNQFIEGECTNFDYKQDSAEVSPMSLF